MSDRKKITILAIGTRGDVQPALALGKALQARGNAVRILCGRGFEPWVESHGLQAAPSQVDMQEVMESPAGRKWVEHGLNLLELFRFGKYLLETYGWQIMTDSWEACRDADLVISSFTSDTYAASIAEKLDIPQVSMPVQPSLVATRCGWAVISSPFQTSTSRLNAWYGRLVLEPSAWRSYGSMTNRLRRTVLGLPAETADHYMAHHRSITVLHGYSPHVVPHPVDWPSNYYTTGYWFLDESEQWNPPPGLEAFLNDGPPPLYIGFGSMTGDNGTAVSQMIYEALRITHQRAVLNIGWANLPTVASGSETSNILYCLVNAPHEWLFPRLAAVIHHGGAGTTASGLRAGRPTLIIPHMADQPYWGYRVAELGVGLRPIMRPRLSLHNLVAAIRQLTDGPDAAAIRQRANTLGEKLRAEDGIANAMQLLDP